MRRALAAVTLACTLGWGAMANAQDPTKTLPQNYWVEFENPWVKVIHVRYRPHEKVPVHDHPPTPTLYVYLSDSGPVRFEHAGEDTFDLTRKPLTTGQMRVSPGRRETHRVENLGDLQSDFLRVEFKSIAFGQIAHDARIGAADAEFWEKARPEDTVFDDPHLRVTRVGVPAGQHITLRGAPGVRTLWLAVRVERAQINAKPAHAGEAWASPELQASAGGDRVELVRVEVK